MLAIYKHKQSTFIFRLMKATISFSKFNFNFERVHPVVFILTYWIYLLPSTQQTFVVLTVINRSNTVSQSFCRYCAQGRLPGAFNRHVPGNVCR
jgi:hypothetical protein